MPFSVEASSSVAVRRILVVFDGNASTFDGDLVAIPVEAQGSLRRVGAAFVARRASTAIRRILVEAQPVDERRKNADTR